MINLDLKNIEIIPSSSDSNEGYDDTQLKSDITQLQNTKADKTELNNYLTTEKASSTYQVKGNYLTEHQNISHLATINNMNNALSNKLGTANILAGDNITLSTSGNNITINSIASGGGSASDTGIRTLHYKFFRAHGSYPLFIADDYSNLKAGDLYIAKIDWGTVSYPNEVTNNLFFPNIDFNFTDFNFVSQQGQGYVKSYLCYLDCEGGGNDTLNIGYCNDTDYEPTNAKLKQLL